MAPYLQVIHLFLCVSVASSESGIYFKKRAETYLTFDSWIVTFSVEILPYRNQLDILSQKSFQQAFNDIVQQDQLSINLNSTQTNKKLRRVHESLSHLLAVKI